MVSATLSRMLVSGVLLIMFTAVSKLSPERNPEAIAHDSLKIRKTSDITGYGELILNCEQRRKPCCRACHGSPITRSAGTKERIASGAKSAPLGQQTVLQTGSRVNFANMFGSRSGSKTGPDSSGRKSTVASQPSLNVTKSEAGPASSAWRICKIIAINPKVQLEVKAAVPEQEPSPGATRRVESRTIQPQLSPHVVAVVLPVFHRC